MVAAQVKQSVGKTCAKHLQKNQKRGRVGGGLQIKNSETLHKKIFTIAL